MTVTGGADFGLSQIGQISMNVHDLDRAIEFYRDRLGIKHLFTVPKMAERIEAVYENARSLARDKNRTLQEKAL